MPEHALATTGWEDTFRSSGFDYVWQPPGTKLILRTLDMSTRYGQVRANIAIDEDSDSGRFRIYADTVNLRDGQARRRFAETVDKQVGRRYQSFALMFDWFCMRVDQRERHQGGEPEKVTGAPNQVMARCLIDPLIVAGKPTWVMAPGGTGKSWVGAAVCVCLSAGIPFAGMPAAKGETLYLDWEDDAAVFRERLYMIARGLGAPDQSVHYRQMVGPLRNYLRPLAAYIQRENIQLVILDSVGMALSGYEGGFEDMALALHADLRALGCAVLALDHVSGEDVSQGNLSTKAYGSIYKMNLARLAWSVRAEEPYGQKLRIGLFNVKANWGKKRRPIGLEFDFGTEDVVRIRKFDVRDSIELSKNLPLREQIVACLKDAAQTVDDIVDITGIKKGRVMSLLKNGRRHGIFTCLHDGSWANLYIEGDEAPKKEEAVPW